jgi:Xaa-Pro aminopeptidase
VRYLCGFTGSSGALALGVRGRGHKAVFFTDGRYTEQARDQVAGAQVVIPKAAAIGAAVKWLTAKQSISLGFEAEHMTVEARRSLGRLIPSGTGLRATTGLVERLRVIKEPAEVAQIKSAINLACSVFEAVLSDIKPGKTEASIAAEIEYMSRGLGAEGMSFDTLVAAGKRSALPHGVASQNRLPERGFVILDFGVILGGYCSDMTRTVHLGRPDKAARTMYEAVLEAQLAGIKAVTSGIECSEVDYATRKVLEKAGLAKYFTHSTGHGVGLEIHEPPGIRKSALLKKSARKSHSAGRKKAGTKFDTLLPGMVITIEPGVYIPGKGGVRIEDMVLVTETGCEVLTPTKKALVVI